MSIMNLQPGAMVMALKDLDPEGANVKQGEMGVVFESADNGNECRTIGCDSYYGQCSIHPKIAEGPLVRWIRSESCRCCIAMGGVCNVYDGDVTEVKSE